MKNDTFLAGIIVMLALCMGVIGCTNSAPKCSDSETKDLVIHIAHDEMAKLYGQEKAKQIEMELSAIRTTDQNEKTGKYSCAAELIFKGPSGEELEKGAITYTSEITDDGDNFYANVYGL